MHGERKSGLSYSTAADRDDTLAAAIGRYIQSSAALERALRVAILRLLPLSDDVGLALINDHSAANNREVLMRLLNLKDIPIDETWRQKLMAALPAVRSSQEDRNRIAHHLILPASGEEYVAMIEKKGARSASFVSAEVISDWALEANELTALIEGVPHADYSNVDLIKQSPSFPLKAWPKRQR